MEEEIQLFILKGLFHNVNYFRNVLTNLDPVYFDEDKAPILKFIKNFFTKYEKIPDYSVVVNVISNSKSFNDDFKEDIEDTLRKVEKLKFDPVKDEDWLFDQTKEFANNRAMFLVLKEGAMEISKKEGDINYGSIGKKMSDALSMDWNEDLGIDFFDADSIDEIYDVLEDNSIRIPTGVTVIDNAINGGIPGKTKFLAVFLGEAGLGKTLILGNTAVNAVKAGKNVLYITFEIDQKELRKRVDASFTDFSINNITALRKEVKRKVVEAKEEGSAGRFIIKEFPPSSVSALEIEAYLHALNLKKQFKPDVLMLDYLGIMIPISKDIKGSYDKGKAVCEEIRSLSDRINCPIITAVQANRSGYGQSSVQMDNIADSVAIAHTADLIIGLSKPEELKQENKIKFQIIKSRISKDGTQGIVDIDYDKLKIRNNEEESEVASVIAEGISKIEKNAKKNNSDIT